jgi:hypothetical protein
VVLILPWVWKPLASPVKKQREREKGSGQEKKEIKWR